MKVKAFLFILSFIAIFSEIDLASAVGLTHSDSMNQLSHEDNHGQSNWQQNLENMPGSDHQNVPMDHGNMPGMDQNMQMDHSNMPGMDHQNMQMDHGNMPGMDHLSDDVESEVNWTVLSAFGVVNLGFILIGIWNKLTRRKVA
ncbi:MAG TPA: hypothetical protein VJ824_10710 [Bacillota bacterium]|nr:hypothetical protein [Bacillota bacterium]